MNWEIVIYDPLLEVYTWDDKHYYTSAKNQHKLEKMMNNDKFVPIWWELIAVSNIKGVRPATQEINFIEHELHNLMFETRQKVKGEIIKYKANFPQKEITPWILKNIIEKYNADPN